VIEGICHRVKETTAQYSEKNPELPLSLSLGHSVRKMEEISVNEVYREADNNMYREKVKNHDILVKGFIQALERKNLLDPQQMATLEELMLDLAGLAGIPHHRLSEISLLARYHDIGMALLAPEGQAADGTAASDDGGDSLKRHSEVGYHIAMSTPYLSSIADWILKHQECWNGKGYPLGIKGEDIPLESRILAIAKAYVELTSHRGQEPGLSPEQALVQIRKEIGKQFDPRLADLFLRMMEKRSAAAR
jgi:HD-GYP domain-containing protein (c-di-GMP phosphodiesterase class II)